MYLPGLPVVPRTISYIPRQQIDSSVLGRLRTGDYIGAYAEDGGLDVTHIGIFIDTPDGPVLRNASSLGANNKVVDSPLLDYLQTVPGVVVSASSVTGSWPGRLHACLSALTAALRPHSAVAALTRAACC